MDNSSESQILVRRVGRTSLGIGIFLSLFFTLPVAIVSISDRSLHFLPIAGVPMALSVLVLIASIHLLKGKEWARWVLICSFVLIATMAILIFVPPYIRTMLSDDKNNSRPHVGVVLIQLQLVLVSLVGGVAAFLLVIVRRLCSKAVKDGLAKMKMENGVSPRDSLKVRQNSLF